MISGRGVTKRFGERIVLDGLELDIRTGERVALLGSNGAGKTTLLRCLLGLTAFEGRLTVDGVPAGARGRAGKEARRRIGYVPQQPPRFDLGTAEFAELFSRLRGADPAGPAAFLDRFGLRPERRADRPLRELSGGMLQKLMLAVSLGAGVSVLLLDEPTASLDSTARLDFLDALAEAPPTTTLLFASHRLDDVHALADRVLLLDGGRIAYDGALRELPQGAAAASSARPLRAGAADRLPVRAAGGGA